MIDDFGTRLLAWFDIHGRKHLPWQRNPSPYRVWVSEIMLQQTQVGTVIGYFERFMARFPTVNMLAAASEDEVLHLWTGLGYYARARNLHKTAQRLTREYNAEFPQTVEQLIDLPGIGRSTAGAIVAIACGGRATILDGNVKRVLARCFGVEGWPGQTQVAAELWQIAETLTPHSRVNDYTQAIMDLGATLCTRSKPNCDACPFNAECVARKTGQTSMFPGKKPSKKIPVRQTCMLLIENAQGEFLLQKRPSTGLWGGLWSFPEVTREQLEQALEGTLEQTLEQTMLADTPNSPPLVAPFRHTFTHFHLDITPIHVTYAHIDALAGLPGLGNIAAGQSAVHEAGSSWYDTRAPQAIGLTRPVTRIFQQLAAQPDRSR
jgi:A/G-specific adenine glycosylase